MARTVNRWALWQAMGYVALIDSPNYGKREWPIPEVRAFHDCEARIRIPTAPARAGKSWSAGHDMIPDICHNWLTGEREERKFLIVGPEYEHADKEFGYIAERLVHQREQIGMPAPTRFYQNPKVGRLLIHWDEFKTTVVGKGVRQVSSVLGDQWESVILSEAAQFPERIWRQGLATRCKKAIWPTTPSVYGRWIKEFFEQARLQGDDEVVHFRFPRYANPFYPEERYQEELARRGADDPYFREQFEGDWDTFYGGRVFPDFQADHIENVWEHLTERGIAGGEGHHCIEPFQIPDHWKRIGGIDFGWDDPTVFLFAAVAPNGDVIVYDEYHGRKQSMGEHLTSIEAQARANGTPKWPIPTYRERKGQAKQIAEDIATDYGFGTIDVDTDRIAGRLRIQHYLSRDPQTMRPRLRIFREQCPALVKELMELHYAEESQSREGQVERWTGADHHVDALRYLLMSRPRVTPQEIVRAEKPTLDELVRRHKKRMRRYRRIGQGAIHAGSIR